MPTPNREMNTMMRQRRQEMMDLPSYEGPTTSEADTESPKEDAPGKAFTVKAPGEPSSGESFEYEPSESTPGAWMVYPPGVPCDDTAYRITMDAPATANDFAGMQEAIEDAGGGNSEPSVVSELDSEKDGY